MKMYKWENRRSLTVGIAFEKQIQPDVNVSEIEVQLPGGYSVEGTTVLDNNGNCCEVYWDDIYNRIKLLNPSTGKRLSLIWRIPASNWEKEESGRMNRFYFRGAQKPFPYHLRGEVFTPQRISEYWGRNDCFEKFHLGNEGTLPDGRELRIVVEKHFLGDSWLAGYAKGYWYIK